MNPDGSVDLLAQLRDIHAAPPVPFWPPAPGWWVLGVLLLVLLAWVARRLLRRWRAGRRRQALLEELAALRQVHDPVAEPQAWLAAVNRLLKIAAMRAHPEASPGTLQGAAWTAFLAGPEDGAAPAGEDVEAAVDAQVPGGPFAPLAVGPYQSSPSFDAMALEGAANDWLRRHG